MLQARHIGAMAAPLEETERTAKPRLPFLHRWALVPSAMRVHREAWAPLRTLDIDQINEAILNTLGEEAEHEGAKLLGVVIPHANFASNCATTLAPSSLK